MVGLIFKLGAASLPQGTLSPSIAQVEHPESHHSAKNASEWHFNAKKDKLHKIQKIKKSKSKSKIDILMVKGDLAYKPCELRPSPR